MGGKAIFSFVHVLHERPVERLGDRSVMLFLVQRMDVKVFKPADHIDPAYGKELRKAVRKGVEIMINDVFWISKGSG